ncbi:MAG: collagen binding domain-containing protein [Thermoanaerobaculia bacterium]
MSSSQGPTRRANAWVDFFTSRGVDVSPQGALTISPVPRDPVRFAAYAKGGLGVTFTARASKADRDGAIDGGHIRLPSGSRMELLMVEEPVERGPRRYSTVLSLVRPLPGFESQTGEKPVTRDLSIARPVTVADLLPGEWHVQLLGDGVPLGYRDVLLGDGTAESVEFRVTSESVAGRVVSAEGKGVSGAHVEVTPPEGSRRPQAETLTDQEGRFSAHFFYGGGEIRVSAFVEGGMLPRSVTVTPSKDATDGLRIEVPASEFTLTVIDDETESPVATASFDGSYEGPSGTQPGLLLMADASGRIRFQGLDAEGEVSGLVKAAGYAVSDPVSVVLREGDTKGSTTVRLRKSSIVSGLVLSDRGPVSGAIVTGPLELAASDDAWPPLVVRTGSDGRFRLEVAPDSVVTIAIWAPGYRLGLMRARTEAEESVILVPRGSDAVFELVNEEGLPVSGVWPVLYWQGTRVPSFVTGSAAAASGCAFERSGSVGSLLFGGCVGPGLYGLHVQYLREGRFRERPAGAFASPVPPAARFVVVREGERTVGK